jgi:UDP-3-O-acyl-N-acetylglucosamine deacetylase
MEAEIEAARKMGLGQGANLENTIVLKTDGSTLNAYRMPLEPARHKILDMLGDLFLLGGLLHAKINAKRSGHESHALLVKKILENNI